MYDIPKKNVGLMRELKQKLKGLLTLFDSYDSAGLSILTCFSFQSHSY